MNDKDEKSQEIKADPRSHLEDKVERDLISEPSYFKFKVNGIEIDAPHQKLDAQVILELAKKKGAIPRKPEDYILQGDKGKYKPEDLVNLPEDNLFITIPNQPTPVA